MPGVVYDILSPEEQDRLAAITAQPLKALRQLQLLEAKLAKYEEERRLERARRFGASSEAGDDQYRLFDEAEVQSETLVEESSPADRAATPPQSKRRPVRKPLPAELPRVVVNHVLPPEQQQCACGCQLRIVGAKVTEQLDVIPASVRVIEHRRTTYSCPSCDESIQTAALPAQPIPKSLASPGLLAHVAVAKYADGLPLYRQSKQFARLGIDMPRNTLAGHLVKVGELIQPLMDQLQHHINQYDVIQMDETPVQVLKEPGKAANSQSYMWVMKGGPPDQPAIRYHYDPSRAQTVPLTLLVGFSGYLQTDGYAGYNAVFNRPDIQGLGCWAHARRKFMDAKKALPTAEQTKGNKVNQALAFIGKLYQLEQVIKDDEPSERQKRRLTDATAILDRFKTWLDKQSVPPQSALGKAIRYTLAQWPRLLIYRQDGRLNIDNNPVENAIRPFALGRRNWLFSDSQGGAQASANLYSLIETAKANGLNDYAYLKMLFTQLPMATSDEAVQCLLPWNIDRDVVNATT